MGNLVTYHPVSPIPLLSMANAVAVLAPIPEFRPKLLLFTPPLALLPLRPALKLMKPSFDRVDGLAWDLASSERLFPLEYTSFENEIAGLLFDGENQSSIGDVLVPIISKIFSLKCPLDFGDNGDNEASDPSTGCSP